MTHHQHQLPQETYDQEPEMRMSGQQGGQMGGQQMEPMGGQQMEQTGGQTSGQMGGQQGTQISGQQGGQMSGQPMEQMGGQPGGQMGGYQLSRRLSPNERAALTSVTEAIEVCEWCADQCVQQGNPDMVECIRLCEDVSELGRTVLALLPRGSHHGQSIMQTFQQALQACANECSRHQQSHCQECSQTLQQVLHETQSLLQMREQ